MLFFLQIKKPVMFWKILLNIWFLCPITSMNINKMFSMNNCMNAPFAFLAGWGRVGICMCWRLRINLAISNKVILNALQTYLHVLAVFR